MPLQASIVKVYRKINYYERKPLKLVFLVGVRKNLGESMSQHKYAQLIASLLYITKISRFDIAFAMNRLIRYTCNPIKVYVWKCLYILETL